MPGLRKQISWGSMDDCIDFTYPVSPPHPVLGLLLSFLFLDLLSRAFSWTESTSYATLSLGADRQSLVAFTWLWLLGAEAAVAVAVTSLGVTWWVGWWRDRWVLSHAVSLWRRFVLFVSSPCKLLDASAQTEANSSAHSSTQVLP